MAKKSKMISCKHCGQEIAASAKACPHCGGKNKKPIFKRVWFWILVILVLLLAIGGGSGSSSSDTGTKKVGQVNDGKTETAAPATQNADEAAPADATEAAPEETEANVQEVYKVGDILQDGDMNIVYMSSGEYSEDNEFMQPADGKKYIFLQLAFINTSESSDNSISIYSFECYADGYACDMYYGGEEDLSATLSAGRSTSGYLYFEVPEDAEEIEIEYESNFWTDEKIKFAYEGDQDCGYVLEKVTTATEGALKVGETAESDSLNIKYLKCFKDKSDNDFIQPKKGYRYITCEFEFENVSSSDESITFYSFDCYADGINCDAAYYRDDAISADLSAGRKAKGTVTFEVPKDAEVVEVEYLTNFWTSNRLVFDAKAE